MNSRSHVRPLGAWAKAGIEDSSGSDIRWVGLVLSLSGARTEKETTGARLQDGS